MGAYLDIIGSMLLGGMLILAFSVFVTDKRGMEMEATSENITQTSVASITSVMMDDLRKAGYKTDAPPFLHADSQRIRFMGDIDDNGVVDTIEYFFQTPVNSTPNPSDSLLYRRVNNSSTVGSDLGLVGIRFSFLDRDGNQTTDLATIASIDVQFSVQSRFPIYNRYPTTVNGFRISPKNIK